MPLIKDLPVLDNLDGTEDVVIEKGDVTGRARLIDYLLTVDRFRRTAQVVATFADRDGGIPLADRIDGMLVKVDEADQWFQWKAATSTWVTPSEFVDHTVLFASPPILDQGTIYFPAFRILRYRQNGYGEFYVPPTGSMFASPASTTAEVRRHVFDVGLYLSLLPAEPTDADRSTAAAAALYTVSGNDAPLVDTATQIILAVSVDNRIVDNNGRPFVGDVPGGAAPNQYPFGKKVDDAPFVYPGLVPVAIADANLLALGFTRGLRGNANSIVSAGGYLDEMPSIGDFVVARFYLHSSVAGQFGQPRLYLYESEQAASFVVPTLFREISPTVREYFYAGRITQAGRVKWAVGTDNGINASIITITGIQFYAGTVPAYWIGRADYPVPYGWGDGAAPLIGDRLFMVSARPLLFFPGNGLLKRTLPALAEVTSSPDVPLPARPCFHSGRADDLYELDAAAIGSTLSLTMRADDTPDAVMTRTVAVSKRTVPLAPPVSINCLSLSDSHGNGAFSINLKNMLAAWGVDINFHGTLPNDVGELAEGRGGWSLANFVGTKQGAAWSSVVAAGSDATSAYLAGDYVARFNAQPFLNAGASGSAAPVISGGPADGHRFDLVHYRDRFALAPIHVVCVNLFSNDMNQPDGLADVVALYPVMLAEIRRAFPDALILCWACAPALVNNAELRWRIRRPALEAIISAVRARIAGGDGKLQLVSGWMHHTVRSGFTLTAGATDPVSGVNAARLSDDVHAAFPADAQIHEAVAAAIVNLI